MPAPNWFYAAPQPSVATAAATQAAASRNEAVAAAASVLGLAAKDVALNFDNWTQIWTDAAGNVIGGFDAAGNAQFNLIYSAGKSVSTAETAPLQGQELGFLEMTVGADGNAAWMVHRFHGPVSPFTSSALAPRIYVRDATTNFTLLDDTTVRHMTLILGQSLGLGQNNLAEAASLSPTAVDPGWAQTFDTGPTPDGRTITSLVDLHEFAYSIVKQTIASSYALALNTRLFAATGKKMKLLVSSAAASGQSYRNLRRGTAAYAEALRQIRIGRDLCAQAGERLELDTIFFMGGESDVLIDGTTREQYRRYIDQLLADLTEDAIAITGQNRPPLFLVYTTDSHAGTALGNVPEVTLAMGDLHYRRPNMVSTGPHYWCDRGDKTGQGNDGLHCSRIGYYQFGELGADIRLSAMHGLPNGGPLRLVEAWFSGATTIDARFSMPVAIDLSDATVASGNGLGAGRGFDFHDLSGTPPAINSVASLSPSFTASIAGQVMTVSAIASGEISVGMPISGAAAGTVVTGFSTGTGGTGTYQVGISQTVASTAMTGKSDGVRITLASAPSGPRKRLLLACRQTGGTCGPLQGNRSVIRSADPFTTSLLDGSTLLYHWATPALLELG